MKFKVIEREDKIVLKEFDSLKEAELDMCQRVRQDMVDGAYEPEFYAIVDENDVIIDVQ